MSCGAVGIMCGQPLPLSTSKTKSMPHVNMCLPYSCNWNPKPSAVKCLSYCTLLCGVCLEADSCTPTAQEEPLLQKTRPAKAAVTTKRRSGKAQYHPTNHEQVALTARVGNWLLQQL
jgi:hypothetical protein